MEYFKKIANSLFFSLMMFVSSVHATERSIQEDQVLYTTPWEALEHGQPLSEDLIMKWYNSINIDSKFEGSPEEFCKAMQWAIFVSRLTVLPEEEQELERDIEQLLQACRSRREVIHNHPGCAEIDCERIENLEDIPQESQDLFLQRKKDRQHSFNDCGQDDSNIHQVAPTRT